MRVCIHVLGIIFFTRIPFVCERLILNVIRIFLKVKICIQEFDLKNM